MSDLNFSSGNRKRIAVTALICLLAFMTFPSIFITPARTEPTPSAVSAGGFHSLLKGDGTAWAWGGNSYGQLGDGTATNRLTPVPVSGLTGVIAISAGYGHSLALKGDGTVWAWGWNLFGQLGDGTTIWRYIPVQVSGLTGVIAVSAGYHHSLALKNDGTARAWGRNFYGQLGDGTTTDRLTQVQVSGLTGVIAVSAGGFHSLALKNDGTARAWGSNEHGQLGDGTTTTRLTQVQVSGLTGVIVISAGGFHSLALKGDGTVWAWGGNGYGQLGDGTTTNRLTPVQVFYHDMAVANVTPSKTIVGQGYPLHINVTVENQGISTESFNLTVYYGNSTITPEQWEIFWSFGDINRDGHINGTDQSLLDAAFGSSPGSGNWNPWADLDQNLVVDVPDAIILANHNGLVIWTYFVSGARIQTLPVINLAAGNTRELTFTWGTSSIPYGNYVIAAYAVPILGKEEDRADNTFTGGTVLVTLPGDIYGDRKVDGRDIAIVAKYFGSTSDYPPNADIDGDRKIDGRDIAIAAQNFGKTWP